MDPLHTLAASEYPVATELENWARWLEPRWRARDVCPMFRLYRASGGWGESGPPSSSEPIRAHDAMRVEAEIRELDESDHQAALRWYYVRVRWRHPGRFARERGVSVSDLPGLLRDARHALARRLNLAPVTPATVVHKARVYRIHTAVKEIRLAA